MQREYGIERVTPKHIGLVSTGLNPRDETQRLPEDSPLQKKALSVWEHIERYDAMHILFLHLLTGKTTFIISGGTCKGQTGIVRVALMKRYFTEFTEQLGITEKFEFHLTHDDNSAHGNALKASQLLKELSQISDSTLSINSGLPAESL